MRRVAHISEVPLDDERFDADGDEWTFPSAVWRVRIRAHPRDLWDGHMFNLYSTSTRDVAQYIRENFPGTDVEGV